MWRFLVTVFKESNLIVGYYALSENRGIRDVKVLQTSDDIDNRGEGAVDEDSLLFFFPTLADAEEFAQTTAAERPGYSCCISEVSQMYVSERPKVIAKKVDEKGVLPL